MLINGSCRINIPDILKIKIYTTGYRFGRCFLKASDLQAMAAWYKKYPDISFSDIEGRGIVFTDLKWINQSNP